MKRDGRTGRSGCLVALLLLAAGCATIGDVDEPTRPFPEGHPKVRVESKRREGSLWCSGCQGSFLFSDHRAREIGDTLTIRIVESSTASNEASTKTEKKNEISLGFSNFLGAPLDFNLKNVWGGGRGLSPGISAATDNSFDGSGATSRKGLFSATLTAQVVDLLPNGHLRIEGRREITVNREKQVIVLSGIVRPKDISQENVVLSSSIADARISFTGTGIISDRQRPGWLTRILDWIWPF